MYTKKKGLAALLAAVTGLSSLAVGTVSAAPAAAEDTEAVKILSLGDSITDGYWTSGESICTTTWNRWVITLIW